MILSRYRPVTFLTWQLVHDFNMYQTYTTVVRRLSAFIGILSHFIVGDGRLLTVKDNEGRKSHVENALVRSYTP
jgi:hypothetical protein